VRVTSRTSGWRAAAASVVLMGVLTACGEGNATVLPTAQPTPIPTSAPTATAEVGFQVQVTPIVVHHRPTATPRPLPTAFIAPAGPYLQLLPDAGPPLSRSIGIRGGHFPPAVTVQIIWSPNGKISPLSSTAYTDRHGGLRDTLSVPASPPGPYRVLAEINGVPYAEASYHVISGAALQVTSAGGNTLVISGRRFIPGVRLALVAYPTFEAHKYFVLGTLKSDQRGDFRFSMPTKRLGQGQYVLRAFSQSTLAAQMAETFFEVVV